MSKLTYCMKKQLAIFAWHFCARWCNINLPFAFLCFTSVFCNLCWCFKGQWKTSKLVCGWRFLKLMVEIKCCEHQTNQKCSEAPFPSPCTFVKYYLTEQERFWPSFRPWALLWKHIKFLQNIPFPWGFKYGTCILADVFIKKCQNGMNVIWGAKTWKYE